MGPEILALQDAVWTQFVAIKYASNIMWSITLVVFCATFIFCVAFYFYTKKSISGVPPIDALWISMFAAGVFAFNAQDGVHKARGAHAKSISDSCEKIYTGIESGSVKWFHKDVVTLTSTHCDADRLYSLLPK